MTGEESVENAPRGVQIALQHDGEGDPITLEDVTSASWSQRQTGEDVVRVEFTDGETDTYWAKNMAIATVESVEDNPDVSNVVSLCKGQCGVFSGWIDECPECGADVRLMTVKDSEGVA